ncbi:PKD domain-containing protein [Paenibacillus tarimensis]|uniref:PKD domain-containing protein n=1 Tax=Paenibacillus tarimensis TaxID=416012 RepID=UPI001F2CC476|nr:PKD domain-containing protein [Paenibacillus tarimensis]MCF2945909.1 PKD domain-containing protein [Paenibacillus tarimensis]
MIRKKYLALCLILTIVAPFFLPFLELLPSRKAAAAPSFSNAHVQLYQDKSDEGNPLKRYAVGFMYYEIWKGSGGWTQKPPGATVTPNDLNHGYTFTATNRVIQDVKITRFDQSNIKHIEYFDGSRTSKDNYASYKDYFGTVTGSPVVSGLDGKGTSKVSFNVGLNGTLDAPMPFDVRRDSEGGDPCPQCNDSVQAYRYYFPVLFEFTYAGQIKTNHYLTDGTSLNSVFQNSTNSMTVGQQYPANPPEHTDYEYVGYKSSNNGETPSGSIITGTPSKFTYSGNFDTYIVNYYYKKAGGKAIVKHVTKDGKSISSVFPDQQVNLELNQTYPFTPPENPNYTFIGHVRSTTGTDPGFSGGSYTSGTYNGLKNTPYNGSFKTLYLYQIYEPAAGTDLGTLKIRHMVRSGSNGRFLQQGSEETQSVPMGNHTVQANGSYGTILGNSINYRAYSSTVANGTSVTATLSRTQNTAYISFFYEKANAFTGNFDIIPSTINYREPFTIRPKDFQLSSCEYIGHRYKIERGGIFLTPWESSKTADTSYSYSTYPWVIGVGVHNVSIKISTSCGESDWMSTKPLTVNAAQNNRPPELQLAWVMPDNVRKPVTEVVEGTTMHLVVINDPSVPTPYDPDGDDLYFSAWHFDEDSDWAKTLPSKATVAEWGTYNIEMDTPGYHTVSATIRDEFGASATASATIYVRSKAPVPIAGCPAIVKAGRYIDPSLFDSSRSYSPDYGKSIDHSRDEWTNKQTIYQNDTTDNITVQVSLHVYDSVGRKSEYADYCYITVRPDIPPVAVIEAPAVGIRNETSQILNKSYSPDGDPIIKSDYMYKYDRNNNGFADDEWQTIHGELTKLSFKPQKVGKYLFYVKVTEDGGKTADTMYASEVTRTMDVVNQAPEVSFSMEGLNPNPDLDPYITIKPSEMLGWPVYVTNSNSQVYSKENLWSAAGNNLVSGEGRNFGPQQQDFYDVASAGGNGPWTLAFPLTNNGYGTNRLSPWRSVESMTSIQSEKMIDPDTKDPIMWYRDELDKIRSNKKLIYFFKPNTTRNSSGETVHRDKIYAVNPAKMSGLNDVYGPYQNYIKFDYKSGQSPYEFIHYWPNGREVTLADGRTAYMSSDRNIVNWELVDGRYLFVQRLWEGSVRGPEPNQKYYEFAVLDAFTGEEIRSTFDKPETVTLANAYWGYKFNHTKGKNVAMYWFDGNGGTQRIHWVEMNMNFEVVRHAIWNRPVQKENARASASYVFNAGKSYNVDAEGNIYAYQYYSNGTKEHDDLNVTKYNSDFTLAWRTYLKPGKRSGPLRSTLFWSNIGASDQDAQVALDVGSGTALAKVYWNYVRPGDIMPSPGAEDVVALDMRTGAIKERKTNYESRDDLSLYHYGDKQLDSGPKYTMRWNGERYLSANGTTTIEGNRTTFDDGSAACGGWDARRGSHSVYSGNNLVGKAGSTCSNYTIFAEYFGDGVYVTIGQSYHDKASTMNMSVSVGQPSTKEAVVKSFTNGQFYSDVNLDNAEVRYSLTMEDVDYDKEWAGFSFRIQSNLLNRYAVETNGQTVRLVKYVNGQRTELGSAAYPMEDKKAYSFLVKFAGNKILVKLNNIPLFEVEDSTYSSGRFGYFADKSYMTYSSLRYKLVTENDEWSNQYAILDEDKLKADVKYNKIKYEDSENDPAAEGFTWSIDHNVRFINNQGVSRLNGKTFNSEQLAFDAVGVYTVRLKAKDDPHPDHRMPNMLFDSYRKSSNEFVERITVHRRPIANFTVAQQPDGKLKWTDYSRDPDRYENASHYSTENTGIDYRATKGVLEKKFYYISPSGDYQATKLVSPQEIGTYEIGMAVRDEYSAWSNYHVVSIDVGMLAAPNNPPVPGFTTSHINTYRGVNITFDSQAYDLEDGGRENLMHRYYIRNGSGAESFQSSSRTNWVKTFSTLGTFTIRQVVEDSEGAAAEYTRTVTIHNRLPNTNILVPPSSDQANPTKFIELRPTFKWGYWDGDADPQTSYEVKIYRYGGNEVIHSGVLNGNRASWLPSVDLPEHVNMYVRVRSNDGYDWGEWSAPKFFYIETNRPPIADFDWEPKPVYEGDNLQLINRSTDPDGDTLTYQWQITRPDGTRIASTAKNPLLDRVSPGSYSVRLTCSDGKAEDSAVKRIVVIPLTLTGDVQHTDQWYSYHKKAGHEVVSHPKDFYAGEELLLRAVTSPAPVKELTAKLEALSLDNKRLRTEVILSQSSSTQFSGKMFNPLWSTLDGGLPKGLHTVKFTVTYRNGVVKTAEVPVRILGSVYQAVRVHRRQ